MRQNLTRRLTAEALGTALLLAAVVGSGIMAERLADGADALALLANTVATAAILFVLITVFGPVSGAQFNPAVTLAFFLRGEIGWKAAASYVGVQVVAAVAGVWLAHLMFEQTVFQTSTRLRDGPAQALSEFVAAFGLVGAILGAIRFRPDMIPATVALYVAAAYWFTASTSFANPAVTLARALSDTFAGIAPSSAAAFVAAQIAGATAATYLFGWLFKPETDR
ncbi:MAG TPA: aquaporin [Caulobacteraceae bacterium]|nr:aquaporin [Caulobacteraceae bacterium]